MRNFFIATLSISSLLLASCGGARGDNPGQAYMPDMYYSRAYESYGYNNVGGEYDSLRARGIHYNGMPVPGTVARGEMVHHLTADSAGMTAANLLRNPYDTAAMSAATMAEAERLYLVNCGVCHGTKLDGNGPLYNGGNGAYPVAPRNLTDDYTKGLTDGHIFHVITYGIRSMGSYGSQLRPEQRWWVIKYIRAKQGVGAAAGATATATTSAGSAAPKAPTTPTSSNAIDTTRQ